MTITQGLKRSKFKDATTDAWIRQFDSLQLQAIYVATCKFIDRMTYEEKESLHPVAKLSSNLLPYKIVFTISYRLFHSSIKK